MIPAPRKVADDKIAPDTIERLAIEAAQIAARKEPNAPLGELYEQFVDPVLRYVARKIRDLAAAEDVASEVWLRVARAIDRYTSRGPGSFPAWLFTIANRLVADHYRAHGRTREALTADMLAIEVSASELTPAEAAEQRDTARAVTAMVNRLPARHAECVKLRFYEGLTIAETAQMMGASETCVKQIQHRALNKLRAVIPARDHHPVYPVFAIGSTATGATAGQVDSVRGGE